MLSESLMHGPPVRMSPSECKIVAGESGESSIDLLYLDKAIKAQYLFQKTFQTQMI